MIKNIKKNLHVLFFYGYICKTKIKRRFKNRKCESSSVGRASAFQAECREFDPRLSLLKKSNEDLKIVNAKVAQLVERQPSKLNVASSTLVFRS